MFDSTAKPDDPVVLAAIAVGWHVAFASVSVREVQGADFEVSLKKHDRVPELAVWDESPWDEARWADEPSSERLEKILAIVSNGGFPRNRSQLTEGQLHQLRDAMILEAHVAAGRAVFVTGDAKAFKGMAGGSSLKACSIHALSFPLSSGRSCVPQMSTALGLRMATRPALGYPGVKRGNSFKRRVP